MCTTQKSICAYRKKEEKDKDIASSRVYTVYELLVVEDSC